MLRRLSTPATTCSNPSSPQPSQDYGPGGTWQPACGTPSRLALALRHWRGLPAGLWLGPRPARPPILLYVGARRRFPSCGGRGPPSSPPPFGVERERRVPTKKRWRTNPLPPLVVGTLPRKRCTSFV